MLIIIGVIHKQSCFFSDVGSKVISTEDKDKYTYRTYQARKHFINEFGNESNNVNKVRDNLADFN